MAESKRPKKAELDKWKKEFGKLYGITTEDDQMVILREPKLAELERAIKAVNAKPEKVQKPFDLQRAILPTIKLYEDPNMLEDEKNMMAVFTKMDEVVKFKEAEVTEL